MNDSSSSETRGESGPLLLVFACTILLTVILVGAIVITGGVADTADDTSESTMDGEMAEQEHSFDNGTLSLAEEVDVSIGEYYIDSSTYLSEGDEIAFVYESRASSSDEVETEIHTIAAEFADIAASKNTATTLTIVVGEIQAIVPEPVVNAYVDDRLEQDALLEAIEVTDIDRTGE